MYEKKIRGAVANFLSVTGQSIRKSQSIRESQSIPGLQNDQYDQQHVRTW